ncbi:1-acyl-sn-glycerol-3-phosphate acyltransferase [Pseudooceanicola sp. HF7]|uniref:lysophospholipid acyltransferase family protein n=1 Tax=Pseudooceanicola sp. HF7 TaxID=2721560 RepID=UPI00142F4CE8|nr:lysophospholipid acyltransferase family protein [Pseudooceanicola sp. HF7]NIZ08334.1 1-acyl-sn-glycerol-3-phosphate acyltransferase [Pseudooceanicola sp. HF7]
MIALQYLLSLIFVIQMYLAMALFGVVFLPWALVQRDGATIGARLYCRYIRWSLRVICGLKTELRGTLPREEVLVASKHQSFLDIIIMVSELPNPKFIMKASLRHAPVLGWYALRIGCVPVDRGRGAEAIRQMMKDVKSGEAPPGQLIIYPQGTRTAPGAQVPYKVGAAVIYEETGQTCYPVAVNVGLFWPRRGLLRRRGTAVVEFLEPIPAGLPRQEFRKTLETVVEARSNALLLEGGYAPDELPELDRGA